jgi:serine/threonine protein kinase
LAEILGRPLNDDEQYTLQVQFSQYIPIYAYNPPVKKSHAEKLIAQIHSVIETETGRRLVEQGFLLNGILQKSGQDKALLYYVVHLDTMQVKCAKVYSLTSYEEEARSEGENNLLIHKSKICPTIVHYQYQLEVTHQRFSGKCRLLIMPLYTISLQEFITAYASRLEDRLTTRVALSLLYSCKTLHEKNLCYCDIKPANLMLDTEGHIVLIDLGGVIPVGDAVQEYTPSYCLDAAVHRVDFRFDLYCVATTLAQCLISKFDIKSRSLYTFRNDVSSVDGHMKELIDICLTATNGIVAYENVKRFALQHQHMELEEFVRWTQPQFI